MSIDRLRHIETLSPAARARTVLAAGTWLSWSAADSLCSAPYFEETGSPVLLVERETSDQLLDIGYASTTSYVLPDLGTVRLGGELWPVVGNGYGSALREFRLLHAECTDCCGARRSHLVGVRLDRVELAPPRSEEFHTVDLDAYLLAASDPIIMHSSRVGAHLNLDHHGDLLILAARLLDQRDEQLVAASVEWIDAFGVDLTVIDDEGSQTFRFPFRVPLSSMDDLGGQLHRLLSHSGTDRC